MRLIINNFIRLLKRHTTVAILNFAGLTLAFAVIFIVAIQLNYDLGYNRSIKDHEKIYRIKYFDKINDSYGKSICIPILQDFSKKFATLPAGISALYKYNDSFTKELNDDKYLKINTLPINTELLNMLSLRIIQGDTTLINSTEKSIILTRSTAKRIFGKEHCIGKYLYPRNGNFHYEKQKIIAIIEDIPKNNTFHTDAFSFNNFQGDSWSLWSYVGYIKIDSKKANSINHELQKFTNTQSKESFSSTRLLSIDPITDIYLSEVPEFKEGSRDMVYALLCIGILILFIALFNLFNLQIALIPSRLPLFCTMRALGLKRGKLCVMVISETLLLTSIAFIFSLLLIDAFSKSESSLLFSADLEIRGHLYFLTPIMGIILLLILLISLYPSIYASSTSLSSILKGGSTSSNKATKTRMILTTIQFIASIVVLTLGFSIRSQYEYMRTKEWGMNKEHILTLKGVFPHDVMLDKSSPLVDELKKNPQIIDCAFSYYLPGKVVMGWGYYYDNQPIRFIAWPVSHNFIEFMGITMHKGYTLQGLNKKGVSNFVVNQAFIDKYNIDNLFRWEIKPTHYSGHVIGVTNNFHFNKLTQAIKPLALVCSNEYSPTHILIKVTGEKLPETIDYIRKVWKEQKQIESDINFLSGTIEQLYKNEENLSTLILLLSLIALIISVMGVYGLTMFSTQQRRKEIAIRKVNGATNGSLIWLLQRAYIIPIGVAFIIATPVSFLIFQYWIRQYPYQVEISPLYFILALLIVTIVTSITILLQSIKTIYTNPIKVLKSI